MRFNPKRREFFTTLDEILIVTAVTCKQTADDAVTSSEAVSWYVAKLYHRRFLANSFILYIEMHLFRT